MEHVGVFVGGFAARLGEHPLEDDLLTVGGDRKIVLSDTELLPQPWLLADVLEEEVVLLREALTVGQFAFPLRSEVAVPTRCLELTLRLGRRQGSFLGDFRDEWRIPKRIGRAPVLVLEELVVSVQEPKILGVVPPNFSARDVANCEDTRQFPLQLLD